MVANVSSSGLNSPDPGHDATNTIVRAPRLNAPRPPGAAEDEPLVDE